MRREGKHLNWAFNEEQDFNTKELGFPVMKTSVNITRIVNFFQTLKLVSYYVNYKLNTFKSLFVVLLCFHGDVFKFLEDIILF